MQFIAKPIYIHKVGELHSASASIIEASNKTTLQRLILEAKTKQAIERVKREEYQSIIEAQVAKQNIIAGYGKERIN